MNNENNSTRYLYSLEVYDNETKQVIIERGYNSNSLKGISEDLYQAHRKLLDHPELLTTTK